MYYIIVSNLKTNQFFLPQSPLLAGLKPHVKSAYFTLITS